MQSDIFIKIYRNTLILLCGFPRYFSLNFNKYKPLKQKYSIQSCMMTMPFLLHPI